MWPFALHLVFGAVGNEFAQQIDDRLCVVSSQTTSFTVSAVKNSSKYINSTFFLICTNFRLYYVHCNRPPSDHDDSGDPIRFVGDYSSKIEKIVRTILELKRKESSVKIIVFSHWDNILRVIAEALHKNAIGFRTKSAAFHKCVEQFKVIFLNPL